jgi:hypothetical protein
MVYKGAHEGIEIPDFGLIVRRGEEVEVEASVSEVIAEFGFEPVKSSKKEKEADA